VIEDTDRPLGHRIVWYCITVFITEEYRAHLRADAPPVVGLETLRWLCQGRSPLLDYGQLRQANSSSGVVMLTLNSGTTAQIMKSQADMATIGRKVADYMPWSVGSYRLGGRVRLLPAERLPDGPGSRPAALAGRRLPAAPLRGDPA